MLPVPSLGLLCPEQPVHGGKAHLEKSSSKRIRKIGSMSCHGSQEFRHGCLQPLATELPGKVIHPDECCHHGRTVHMLPLSGPRRGSGRHQCHCSQDHTLGIPPEQVSCIGRAVPRGSTELLQHDSFLLLPGTEVPQSNLFPDMLFLLH